MNPSRMRLERKKIAQHIEDLRLECDANGLAIDDPARQVLEYFKSFVGDIPVKREPSQNVIIGIPQEERAKTVLKRVLKSIDPEARRELFGKGFATLVVQELDRHPTGDEASLQKAADIVCAVQSLRPSPAAEGIPTVKEVVLPSESEQRFSELRRLQRRLSEQSELLDGESFTTRRNRMIANESIQAKKATWDEQKRKNTELQKQLFALAYPELDQEAEMAVALSSAAAKAEKNIRS
jgi:hypothetical protein